MYSRYFESVAHAAAYAKFRPTPPKSLVSAVVNYLKSGLPESTVLTQAVDVGCGSGQSTQVLAEHFAAVNGFDISEAQIKHAVDGNTDRNVSYSTAAYDKIPVSSNSVQLVTSCQACHWFDMKTFYSEVDRILIRGGVLALYGYLLPRIVGPEASAIKLNCLMDEIYGIKLKGCWGEDRLHVDNAYSDSQFDIPYPGSFRDDSHYYDKIQSVADLTGYLSSWSGFREYCARQGDEAGLALLQGFQDSIMNELSVSSSPEDTMLVVRLNYFLRLGRKPFTK